MKLVVGLGNPGRRYIGTRHNVGFEVLNRLAVDLGVTNVKEQFEGEIAEGRDAGHKLLLIQPQTFMNRSGRCVRKVLDFYNVAIEGLLIVCDDISLPLGRLRVRAKGTAGGHNGLKDIQQHLGTTEYSRLRIGVDAPGSPDAVDHVLGKFRPVEKPVMEEAITCAAEAVRYWVQHGVEACMNQYNA